MTHDLYPELWRECYPGNNDTCIFERTAIAIDFVLYLVFVLSIVLTILGNFVVIVSVCHFKQLHKPTNVLISSLALADLLVGVIVMPLTAVRIVNSCWYFGDFVCNLYAGFELFFTTLSIFHLICIAIDRYQAICNPLHYSRIMTMSVAVIMVCVSWTLAAVYSFGIILSKAYQAGIEHLLDETCLGSCFLYYSYDWAIFSSVFTFFFPCTVIVCLYIQIFIVAKKHVKKIGSKKNCSNDRGKGQTAKQSEHKAAKTLSIVLGVFIFCWAPVYLDFLFGYNTPILLKDMLLWLGYFNSALNPIIYALFYPSFRTCFHCIITFKIFSPNSSTMNLSVK